MNNLLDFEEYVNQIRLVERHIIKNHLNKVNEGLGVNFSLKKAKASRFVKSILKDEIELGRQFEERIKNTMEELSDACKDLEAKSKRSSDFTKRVNTIISDINNVSFDALTLIGDQSIDFSGFVGSVALANVVEWGAILSPIRNVLIIKKVYNYFMGLIKQSIRKNLVMLIVNFDQFQNIILQKSIESADNARSTDLSHLEGALEEQYKNAFNSVFKKDASSIKKLEQIQKIIRKDREEREANRKNDTISSLFNSYDNTYKQTAEAIKSYINDDSQKQLEACKTAISKLSHGNDDLTVYGELLITIAEEKALKTSNAINNNFLKMSEVFKLSNQKNLIELISEAEKDENKRIKETRRKVNAEYKAELAEEKIKFYKDEFEKIKMRDDIDLTSIEYDDLEKLKDETKEFKFKKKDSKDETSSENISLYDILVGYLSIPKKESADELENCSDDIKLIISTPDNYDNCYQSYVDILSDSVNESLIVNEHKSKFDLFELKSVEDIIRVINKFDLLDYTNEVKKKHEKIFKYINDNINKIERYDLILEMFETISKSNDITDLSKLKDIVKKHVNLKEWEEYERKSKRADEKEDIKEPTCKKPTLEDDEKLNLSISDININRCKVWKEAFDKMPNDIENNEKEGKK